MRKAILLRGIFDELDGLKLSWANTLEEYRQAFSLVHEEYLRAGYIQRPNASRMLFNLQNLLPCSSVLLISHRGVVVSTLSLVQDTNSLGLPMDSIYSSELNSLRGKGRRISEACGLATSNKFRWKNIFMFTFRAIYWHALENNLTDICVMVNPKHAAFYKTLLLFEEIGPEKHYPRLGVPAVALRLNLEGQQERLWKAYKDFDRDCNLYKFVYENFPESAEEEKLRANLEQKENLGNKVLRHFLPKNLGVVGKLTPRQRSNVLGFYRGLRAIH